MGWCRECYQKMADLHGKPFVMFNPTPEPKDE